MNFKMLHVWICALLLLALFFVPSVIRAEDAAAVTVAPLPASTGLHVDWAALIQALCALAAAIGIPQWLLYRHQKWIDDGTRFVDLAAHLVREAAPNSSVVSIVAGAEEIWFKTFGVEMNATDKHDLTLAVSANLLGLPKL